MGHRRLRNAALLLASLSGCGSLRPGQHPEHASASILNGGPSAPVTPRQAADVQIAMGRSLEESGDRAKAEAAYREALKKDPKRGDAEARLAVLCDQKGNTAEADRHFVRALDLDPKDPEILCDSGYSFYLQRRWAEAESRLRRAIEIDPRHARSRTNLGLVLASQGDDQGALAEFARAGCDPADAQVNLGLVLALEGRLPEAKKAYAAALAAKPASAAAQEGLRAATVALEGGHPSGAALAKKSPEKPRADPAVREASTAAAR